MRLILLLHKLMVCFQSVLLAKVWWGYLSSSGLLSFQYRIALIDCNLRCLRTSALLSSLVGWRAVLMEQAAAVAKNNKRSFSTAITTSIATIYVAVLPSPACSIISSPDPSATALLSCCCDVHTLLRGGQQDSHMYSRLKTQPACLSANVCPLCARLYSCLAEEQTC